MTDQQFLTDVQAAAGLATRKDAEHWAKAVVAALADLAPAIPDAQRRVHDQRVAELGSVHPPRPAG